MQEGIIKIINAVIYLVNVAIANPWATLACVVVIVFFWIGVQSSRKTAVEVTKKQAAAAGKSFKRTMQKLFFIALLCLAGWIYLASKGYVWVDYDWQTRPLSVWEGKTENESNHEGNPMDTDCISRTNSNPVLWSLAWGFHEKNDRMYSRLSEQECSYEHICDTQKPDRKSGFRLFSKLYYF